jgi:hypothetical protein
VAVISVSPATVALGKVDFNVQSANNTVVVTNTGTAVLTLNTIGFTGTYASDFSRSGTCQPAGTVPPNATCTLIVSVKPTGADKGPQSASLNISSNGGNQTIALSYEPITIIQRENAKTPDKNWEMTSYAFFHEIEGYASATSVARGGTIKFYVNTIDPNYTVNIYRLGWYGGVGGRLMQLLPVMQPPVIQPPATNLPGTVQPPCPVVDAATSLLECNWNVSYSLTIPNNTADPTDWASGYYVARLQGSSNKESYIPFVVRDDSRPADLLMQSSVTTYQAYNNWGQEPITATNLYPGKSLYGGESTNGVAAAKVSFNRPYNSGYGAGQFRFYEIRMMRFLEREGYDVTYATNIDTHTNGRRLLSYKGFLSVGHDEYWTKQMRDAVEGARDGGVNLGFFGANTAYWQIRLEPSTAAGDANRTMVSYKSAATDPLAATNPAETTTQFRLAPVNRPEAALVGVMYDYSPVNYQDIVISNCLAWICAGGKNLVDGSRLVGMLGYEVDRLDKSSPANIIEIGKSLYATPDRALPPGPLYSSMTYYQAASGAGVFATGSMQWNYGLDYYGPSWPVPLAKPPMETYDNVQQMTRNVLKSFGASP